MSLSKTVKFWLVVFSLFGIKLLVTEHFDAILGEKTPIVEYNSTSRDSPSPPQRRFKVAALLPESHFVSRYYDKNHAYGVYAYVL